MAYSQLVNSLHNASYFLLLLLLFFQQEGYSFPQNSFAVNLAWFLFMCFSSSKKDSFFPNCRVEEPNVLFFS